MSSPRRICARLVHTLQWCCSDNNIGAASPQTPFPPLLLIVVYPIRRPGEPTNNLPLRNNKSPHICTAVSNEKITRESHQLQNHVPPSPRPTRHTTAHATNPLDVRMIDVPAASRSLDKFGGYSASTTPRGELLWRCTSDDSDAELRPRFRGPGSERASW